MAGSVNRVILVGNLGADPEFHDRQNSDSRIGSFTVATSESWTDRESGERRERTEWHRVVCYHDHINAVLERRAQKGTQVYLEGRLQTRKWQDQSGEDRYTTEVVIERFGCSLEVLNRFKGQGQGQGQGESGWQGRYEDDWPSRNPSPAR